MPVTRCDIFCKIIDNYGDIGVCWRLARQLTAEHALALRLWVDDLGVFARLDARVDAFATTQEVAGVQICQWDAANHADVADIVIEAFACDPPEAYIAAMAARQHKPAWINLEYLTAEGWAAQSHCLPSPHPRLPLIKYFFFPGFTPATGGLLREDGLTARLKTFQADPLAQQEFWLRVCATPPAHGALKVSLFAYENAALPGLLDAWAHGPLEIHCAVTAGRHVPQVQAWLEAAHGAEQPPTRQAAPPAGRAELQPGVRIGRLTLAFLPFLPQPDYDLLLAACDLNFVRGEDSFVRAQWAARPLVWHIYQQEEAAHQHKLDAFLGLYSAALNAKTRQALHGFWQSWEDEAEAGELWPELLAALPALQAHAEKWANNLGSFPDLASKLLIFSKDLLECATFPKAVGGPPQD